MKRKAALFIIIDMIVLFVFGLVMFRCTSNQEKLTLNVYLGESHTGNNNIAQLFYAEKKNKFKSSDVITQTFEDKILDIKKRNLKFHITVNLRYQLMEKTL